MAELSEIRETVRERYAAAAKAAAEPRAARAEAGCCGAQGLSCSPADATGVFGGDLYDEAGADGVPEAALSASLGCGVPTAVADLHEGEVVLDLGSGAGVDVLISARRVGPTGKPSGGLVHHHAERQRLCCGGGGGGRRRSASHHLCFRDQTDGDG